MFEIKYKLVGYFDKYPKMGEEVFVKTKKGIFKAKYQRWDWSDSDEIPYFDFNEGNEKEVIAWSYQPDRLNPEDHIEDKFEMICDSQNSENK